MDGLYFVSRGRMRRVAITGLGGYSDAAGGVDEVEGFACRVDFSFVDGGVDVDVDVDDEEVEGVLVLVVDVVVGGLGESKGVYIPL
jgi:hypothetical protein